MMELQSNFVSAGEGLTHTLMPGEQMAWKATGATTDSALDCCELLLDPQVGPPEHIHHTNDEAIYILEGTLRMRVGGESADLSAGSFVFIARGTPHAWKNIGSAQARLLIVFTPGGMDGFFREMAPLVPTLMAGMANGSEVDASITEKAEAIMRHYQYELVGPPLA